METDQIDTYKAQVLAVTCQLTKLMIDRDTVKLNKILDAHFRLTHITGYVQSKQEWFSEIVSERMKYYSYKEVKTSVEIAGDKATFIGQNILMPESGDHETTGVCNKPCSLKTEMEHGSF